MMLLGDEMTSSFQDLKRKIEEYEATDAPVSAILEISLKDSNTERDEIDRSVYTADTRASIRGYFMRYIEANLATFSALWNGQPFQVVFIQVDNGKVHFYTRQGYADQMKAIYMKQFKEFINGTVNQQPWVRNVNGLLSFEFILSKPLVYLEQQRQQAQEQHIRNLEQEIQRLRQQQ